MNQPSNVTLSEGVPYCKIRYSFQPEFSTLPQITTSEGAYSFFMEIWDHDTISYKEEFVVVLLNNAKKVLGWSKISSGGSNATIVEPSMVFQIALLAHANSIILAHNHPSGILKPSTADINLTSRIKEAGKILGIQIVDHLIITPHSFNSFAEKGLL